LTTPEFENTGNNHKTQMGCFPPHSRHLTSLGVSFFGARKKSLHGKEFGSDDEFIDEVKKWL
jgi:hypothetical protein